MSRMRIGSKLLLVFIPLIVMAVGVSAYMNYENEKREMLKQAQASAQTYAELIRESLVHMMMSRGRIDDDYINQVNNVRDVNNLHIHFATDSLRLKEVYLDSTRMARLRLREGLEHPLTPEEKSVFITGQPAWIQKGLVYNSIIPFKSTSRSSNATTCPKASARCLKWIFRRKRMNASIESNTSGRWIVYIYVDRDPELRSLSPVMVEKQSFASSMKQKLSGRIRSSVIIASSQESREPRLCIELRQVVEGAQSGSFIRNDCRPSARWRVRSCMIFARRWRPSILS
jgi:hypothetical protein